MTDIEKIRWELKDSQYRAYEKWRESGTAPMPVTVLVISAAVMLVMSGLAALMTLKFDGVAPDRSLCVMVAASAAVCAVRAAFFVRWMLEGSRRRYDGSTWLSMWLG